MVKGSKKEKNKREIFIQKSVFAKNSERGVKVGPASKVWSVGNTMSWRTNMASIWHQQRPKSTMFLATVFPRALPLVIWYSLVGATTVSEF